MLKKIENVIKKACWVPFALAFIGYFFVAKEPFWHSVYSSVTLYFVNPVSEVDNGWIMTAKLLSVIVVAGVILIILQSLYENLNRIFIRIFKDSTAVYSDDRVGKIILRNLKHGYLHKPSDSSDVISKKEKTKHHILAYSDDIKSLSFYNAHKDEFENQQVYFLLREMDSSMLKAFENSNVHLINMYELMAREYWRKHSLFDLRDSEKIQVAIIGIRNTGMELFKYGYLNNIFSLSQHIEYHLWDCDEENINFINYLNTRMANQDSIIIHDESYKLHYDEISKMDRIILADANNQIRLLQSILLINPSACVHCYTESKARLQDYYAAENIRTFGNIEKLLTEDNIKREQLYRQGKLIHYDYCMKDKDLNSINEQDLEAEWKKLNGFLRGSNIARADHLWIEFQLRATDPEMEEKTIWELEHIRWCRYHYMHYWKYDQKRDKEKRLHPDLVPFNELDPSEQKKDGFYHDVIKKEIEDLIKKEAVVVGNKLDE